MGRIVWYFGAGLQGLAGLIVLWVAANRESLEVDGPTALVLLAAGAAGAAGYGLCRLTSSGR